MAEVVEKLLEQTRLPALQMPTQSQTHPADKEKLSSGLDGYLRACEMGNGLGCSDLGISYGEGKGGLAKDLRRATELYRKACGMGAGEACSSLGYSYSQGIGGLVKDQKRANELYRKACDLGFKKACRIAHQN